MSKRGFTLIELLAVITILSLILLITFVSMSSVVKNSKNNLHDNQISQLEKAAEYYNNKEGLKDYDICINVEDLIDNGYIKQDEIKDPKSGKNIEGSVNISYNGKKYSYKYQEKLCTYSFIKLVSDADNDGEISIGDEYTFKVNATDTFNFYVISIEENKVNLIMDSNICNDGTLPTSSNLCKYAWYDDGDDPKNYDNDTNVFGPLTAMINLYNGTKGWTNVPDMIMDYEDENNKTDDTKGYESIKTDEITKVTTITGKQNNASANQTFGNKKEPLKARLAREDEITTDEAGCSIAGASDEHFGTCNYWIVKNLYYNPTFSNYCSICVSKYEGNLNYGKDIAGYWILSSYPRGFNSSRRVSSNGHLGSDQPSKDHLYGIRPVITVSKFDLLYAK